MNIRFHHHKPSYMHSVMVQHVCFVLVAQHPHPLLHTQAKPCTNGNLCCFLQPVTTCRQLIPKLRLRVYLCCNQISLMKKLLLQRALLLFTIQFSFLTFISAQQDAQYSMYRFNGLYINPAYTGSHDVIHAMAIYRHQWVKMPGQPQTASVAIHSPLKKEKVALGLIYTFDKIGVTKTNSINASFAYRFIVGKKKDIRLSLGLSTGVMNYNSNLGIVKTTEPGDPNFEGNNQNRWLPEVGFGFYAYSKKFYAGISLPHLLAMRLNGKTGAFETSSMVAHQYYHLLITGGYVFDLGKKVKFMPSVLMKYVPVHAPLSFDFNITFIFIDRIWLGAGYRLNDSYNFMLAVNATKQLRIGYAYDLTVSPLNKYTTGSHEVMISFDGLFEHSGVVSPRYVKYF